jgi:hypothetical protein
MSDYYSSHGRASTDQCREHQKVKLAQEEFLGRDKKLETCTRDEHRSPTYIGRKFLVIMIYAYMIRAVATGSIKNPKPNTNRAT